MTDRATEPGFELVLDNQKLIIAFAVLIAICGCFFVVGFIEGKRQGFREGSQPAAESSTKAGLIASESQASKPADADSGMRTSKGGSEEQPVEWYKNVNGREKELGIASQTTADSAKKIPERKPAAAPAGKIKAQGNTAHPGPVTYSVQVGAFRQLKEAESRAQTLRFKGYDYRIESPHPPEQLYLLKVGKFSSRTEASAVQLRLRKSGFTSAFIKAN